jgi:hypothetical protein
MRKMNVIAPFLVTGLLLAAFPAHAYVGPGLGLGAIAVILGIVISVVIALLAIIWYPIKRRMAARKNSLESDGG